MPVPDKENYREAVCDVDRNVAHCFFQSSTKKPAQKTPACPIAGETALFGRKLCEEFAPRNEDIRLSEGRGANRPRTRAAISESCGPWFAYVTESSGLAGSRTQTAAAASLQASGSRSAYTKRLLRNSGAALFLYLNY